MMVGSTTSTRNKTITIRVPHPTKKRVDKLIIHPRESYVDVMEKLIKKTGGSGAKEGGKGYQIFI